VLKPTPVENRVPDSTEEWLGRAYVAIAIEALIKAGNNPDEAKLFIQAREYSPLSALMTKKAKNPWTAAREWRYRFRENRAKNDVAQKVFDAANRELKKLSSSSDFTKAARMSLSMAVDIVQRLKLSSD